MRVVVRGRVQGVGFRAFVRNTADRFGASGEVWNREDGAVEAVFGGLPTSKLGELAQALRDGPGWVESIDVFDHKPAPPPGFRIGPTRPA